MCKTAKQVSVSRVDLALELRDGYPEEAASAPGSKNSGEKRDKGTEAFRWGRQTAGMGLNLEVKGGVENPKLLST